MAADGLVQCYNKGCGKRFDLNANNDGDCQYHPGGPVFHDALKGWSCCKKRSTDFSEFLSIPGCTNAKHNEVKPPEAEKQQKPDNEVIPCEPPRQPVKPKDPNDRPSASEPKQKLKCTIGASLKTALEKKLKELSLIQQNADTDGKSGEVKIGTSCKRNACKSCYNGDDSNKEKCLYHPGTPIFHEGMKFWSCCQRKTSDFENFLEQEGCETETHLWINPESNKQKIACRTDWHQTPSTVTISVFTKVAVPDKCLIEANQVSCNIFITFEGGKNIYERHIELREVNIFYENYQSWFALRSRIM
ncbi:cysteine and histidine-rich domain-containing protein 1-like [Mizuhopecten yessoensis]|uniref:Cysteine and histidine-rich domain-containing protein 1 n=1 Tax=Mizuhopecten yessoensis TaxID=6573 RepID=A0A210Q5D0_MIZYE|nr:cysteine and histidine-rich domain-containing protein 1-like [Mizuhopecten yessoensis]OWF43946.1 Cysteine and histidine-rich domain-containing protein 1 [Mizuhopecten yessoensis]